MLGFKRKEEDGFIIFTVLFHLYKHLLDFCDQKRLSSFTSLCKNTTVSENIHIKYFPSPCLPINPFLPTNPFLPFNPSPPFLPSLPVVPTPM